MTKFLYDVAHNECMKYGLVFDDKLAAVADTAFIAAKLSQTQVDRILRLHVSIVRYTFDRKRYSWYQRALIALYWIGIGPRIKSDDLNF